MALGVGFRNRLLCALVGTGPRAVPLPPSKRARVSSVNSTHWGIRLGAAVHSASWFVAVSPWRVYMGS